MAKSTSQNSQQKPKKQTSIRIIGGSLKGRKLTVPNLEGLRPSTDRIRETLFNWLMFRLDNPHTLDAFAGSGALGFEAISRHGGSCLFLDIAKQNCNNIQKNISHFSLKSVAVNNVNTIDYLKNNSNNQQFNLIFLDPPFGKDLLNNCLSLLLKNNFIAENALIYIEHEIGYALKIDDNFSIVKELNTKTLSSKLLTLV